MTLQFYFFTIDCVRSFDTSHDELQNCIDYVNSFIQNLSTREEYEKQIFIQHVGRFRNEIHASLASSSNFESIPSSENMPMKRKAPWFSPSKMHKRRSFHKIKKSMTQNLSERVDEHGNFQFPFIRSKKKKGEKVINHSGIAIQGERVILSQQGEYIYLKVLY